MSTPAGRPPDPPLAGCRLDLVGLRAQRERYRRLGRHIERIERLPQRLEAHFTADLDATLLDETLAIERACCPFFTLAYDATRRELAITVQDPTQDPALDALQHALTDSP